MKQIFCKAVAAIICVVVVFAAFPTNAFAAQVIGSMEFTVYVDGFPFHVWGLLHGLFNEGDESPAGSTRVKLCDLAYMLNGTPAQFDIVTPPESGVWDFWIRRGAAYTPNGTEMQEITPSRAVLFGSSGGITELGLSFDRLFHRAIIGFDGEYAPAHTITLAALRDIDDIFLPIYDLSYWLGFTFMEDWSSPHSISATPTRTSTPNMHIRRDTFPVGTRQTIDYASVLRVRTGPANSYDILTFVHRGEEFEILDYRWGFVQIETPRGTGWIFAGFLSRNQYRNT